MSVWAIERTSQVFLPMCSRQLPWWVWLAANTEQSVLSHFTCSYPYSQPLLAYLNCLKVMKLTCHPGATDRTMVGWIFCSFLLRRCGAIFLIFFKQRSQFNENRWIGPMAFGVKKQTPWPWSCIMLLTFGLKHYLISRSWNLVFHPKYHGTSWSFFIYSSF